MSNSNFISHFDAIFFDLDGTLLAISDEDFEKSYIPLIAKRFSPYLDNDNFVKALWRGTEDMMKSNDPDNVVLEAFFNSFTAQTGVDRKTTYELFDQFYRNEFKQLKNIAEDAPEANKIIKKLLEKDKKVVLATNPVFPEIATRIRCEWTNINYDDFDYVSHAQNFHVCKPNPQYYLTLCKLVDVKPENVLMVGNDYLFDMAASNVGMKTWMIDKHHGNIEHKDKFTVDYEGPLTELLNKIS